MPPPVMQRSDIDASPEGGNSPVSKLPSIELCDEHSAPSHHNEIVLTWRSPVIIIIERKGVALAEMCQWKQCGIGEVRTISCKKI